MNPPRLLRFHRWAFIVVSLIALLLGSRASAQSTVYYFVRHAEVDPRDPKGGLSEAGKVRARLLADLLREVSFTQIFCPHTERTRLTVELIAQRRGLTVVQLPKPGSTQNGKVITDRTPSAAATAPMVEALRRVPDGSVVLVGVNSSNAFAILHGLGVPVASADHPSAPDQTSVPCLDGSCFPQREYDNLWILILEGPDRKPRLLHQRYGAPAVAGNAANDPPEP